MSTTRSTKAKTRFLDVDGRELLLASSVSKTHRDILFEYLARPDVEQEEPPVDTQGKKAKKKTIDVVVDFSDPLSGKPLTPGPNAILCQKCGLNKFGCKNPYLEPIGAEDPLITVVFESVSKVEDEKGVICSGGTSGHLASLFSKICQKLDFPYNRIRWLPLVRCSKKIDDGKTLNYKTKAQWCGHYALDDIRRHPPKIIMPIGTTALGYFSYKSNAQDWGGKLLTFRGWPDDWLMDPKFSRPSPYPVDPEKYPEAAGWTVEWHPFFGKPPTSFDRIPLMPVQHPKIILAAANRTVSQRWFTEIAAVIQSAKDGITPRQYDRPWYKISEDPDEIIANLQWLIDHRRTLVTYDTETTGLYPFSEGAAIVYMMFRWDDDQGEPRSIGFPWDYDGSPIRPYIDELSPVVVAALQASRLIGHNLTFDALFTYANVKGVDLDKLADACGFDTWHEAFVLQQQRGTLGLDMMAYRFVPDLAGYDEDYSILIELYRELLHPDEGGHYANCPAEYRETHFKHYVMGDVEVAHQTHHVLQEKLAESPTYKIPLAHPTLRGKFRLYSPPSRHFVYNRIVSPASQVLIKMMGRGMHINLDELSFQEETFPQLIFEARRKMREVTPEVLAWCETMEATEPGWFFDLESKEQLRHVLFTLMGLPVKNLTESGRKKYESVSDAERFESREDFLKMAAIDKFTLNILAAENPKVRPLLEYRSIYKQYSSYVRPMRNIHSAGIDKRERSKHQHLMRDGRVHAKFIIPGTRSGRLASADPNLQQLGSRGMVKRLYGSRFGREGGIYQGDLSQIELRLIAAACGDESMVRAYCDNIDLHSLTMSKIFNLPYDHCTKEYTGLLQKAGKDTEAKDLERKRKLGKTLNFLTGYGGGAQGFQGTLAEDGIYYDLDTCESFLAAFFEAYPSLRKYLSFYKHFIQENAVAVSILGRVRAFEEVYSDDKGLVNKALRAGCNHLIQATASDMMLICNSVIEGLMREAELQSVITSTVHDSLVIDFYRPEIQTVHDIVMDVFTNIPDVLEAWLGQDIDLSWSRVLPFDGDAEVGANYGDLHKIERTGNDWDAIFAKMDEKE